MQKNVLMVLGLVVVILVAWLVVAVAYQGVNSTTEEATTTSATITPQVDVSTSLTPSADTEVETSIEIVEDNVPVSVTVTQ